MQVIRTKQGTHYREKVYVDGKAIHSPRFLRKTDAVNWKAGMTSDKAKYQSTGQMPKTFSDLLNPAEVFTFSEYANTWLNTRVKLQLSRRTFEHYASVIRLYLVPKFGKLKLGEIRLKHGDQLIEHLMREGHNARGINLIIGIFKRVLIEAVKENRLDKNPLMYLKEIKEPPRPDIFLSLDEINQVLELSKGQVFHSLFLVAINTGMRRGELAGLCWDKINFGIGLMEIFRLRDRQGLSDRTKTVKSRRFIPMNITVRNHLLALKEKTQGAQVFLESDGRPFDVDHLYRDFRAILKRAGIAHPYRFHDLRHTFASHFMMNGGNIYDLQKILGHTSLEMTQRYAHLAPEHLVQAVNVVNFGGTHGAHKDRAKLNLAP